MQYPRKFFKSYLVGFFPLAFMIVPPGILLNLAFAKSGIATAGESSCTFEQLLTRILQSICCELWGPNGVVVNNMVRSSCLSMLVAVE